MGQQRRKVVKRNRAKRYAERLKARIKEAKKGRK